MGVISTSAEQEERAGRRKHWHRWHGERVSCGCTIPSCWWATVLRTIRSSISPAWSNTTHALLAYYTTLFCLDETRMNKFTTVWMNPQCNQGCSMPCWQGSILACTTSLINAVWDIDIHWNKLWLRLTRLSWVPGTLKQLYVLSNEPEWMPNMTLCKTPA